MIPAAFCYVGREVGEERTDAKKFMVINLFGRDRIQAGNRYKKNGP